MQKKIEKTKNPEFCRKSERIKLNESLCTRNMVSIVVVYGADEHLLQKNEIKKKVVPSTCSRARRGQLMRVRLKSVAHAINARMYYYGDLVVLKGGHRQRFCKFTEECIKVQNTFLIQKNSICHKPPISYFAIIVLPF